MEECEQRLVLTTTVFLDFGSAFGGGGLTVSDADMALPTIKGPNVFGAGHNLQSLDSKIQAVGIDFDGSGTVDANDTLALANQVLASVRQIFAPFEVNVQIAQAATLPNTAASLAANGTSAGNRDVYVVIAGDAPAGISDAFGASRTDAGNLEDNTAFVFANEIIASFPNQLVNAIASMAAHEAGHSFGLSHTKGSDPLVTGDVMNGGPYSAEDFSSPNVFTRFDLPLDPGPGSQNSFDILAANLGLAPTGPATITGTDLHDKITITRLSASTAQVTVEAFSNATKLPADSLGTNTYVVDTTLGLLVDAGEGDDLINVDADILRNIEIRGGAGTDAIQINGTGNYMPTGAFNKVTYNASGAGAGSVDFDGKFQIAFSEFEPLTLNLVAGVLTISTTDGLGHNILLEDDGDTANNMSKVSFDGGLESAVFINPNALFLEGGVGNDTITLQKLDPGMVGNVVIKGNTGNDTFIVDSTSGLVTGLSSLLFDGGAGFDRLDIVQTGGSQVSESVFVGALPGSGRHVLNGLLAATQTVDFQNIEPLTTNVIVGTFNITSTPGIASLLNANNEINYSAGTLLAGDSGRVTIDNFEPIEFQNKTNFVLSAGSGNDHVVLDNAAAAPLLLKTITVNGEAGNDLIEALNLNVIADAAIITPIKLTGGAGNDRLIATDLEQTINIELQGDANNDFLAGGKGNNIYGGGSGFDTILIQGTPDNDLIAVEQLTTTTMTITRNGVTSNETFATVEAVQIDGGDGDDTIGISVADGLRNPVAPNNDLGSLAFQVIGSGPNASDRLIVRDDGPGDLVIHRQGADGQSGSITVGVFKPVTYEGIEFVNITPLNTATGATGTDAGGQLIVFPYDKYESNASRLVATPLGGKPVFLANLTIDPGPTLLPPFGAIGGDEDWFEFKADKTSVFSFEVLFRKIETVPNGRAGLPNAGNLIVELYDAAGVLVATGADLLDPVSSAFLGKSVDAAILAGQQFYLRVLGDGTAINVYQLNVKDADQVGPHVYDPDGAGNAEHAVHITGNPGYNLFNPKPTVDGPTPLIYNLTIHFQDFPARITNPAYGALDDTLTQSQLISYFKLVGDHTGNIPIASVSIFNDTPVLNQPATARVVLRFASALPDDRFTLTVFDGLTDPAGNKLDGEGDGAGQLNDPDFASGNGVSGGNFVARFTVDSRPEIGAYAGNTVTTDINGNFKFDPTNADAANRDLVFQFGLVSDQRLAGKLGPASSTGTYFDTLIAYGKENGVFRFLIDKNLNGAFDGPAEYFASPQINGLAVAANFVGPKGSSDELAIFDGTRWHIDVLGANTVVNNGLRGYPLAGDFDGDGKGDLATYQNNKFYFDLASNGFGQLDGVISFGAPGVLDRAIAADMDGDGITDIGIWVPQSGSVLGSGEWRFLISNQFGAHTPGSLSPLQHVYSPSPVGWDLAAQFGDPRALPIVGNFDPPAVPANAVARTTAPTAAVVKTTTLTTTVSKTTTTSTTKTQTPAVTTPAKSAVTTPVVQAKTTSPATTAASNTKVVTSNTATAKVATPSTTTTKSTPAATVTAAVSSTGNSVVSTPTTLSVLKTVKPAPILVATTQKVVPLVVTASKSVTTTTPSTTLAKTAPVVTAATTSVVASKKTTANVVENAAKKIDTLVHSEPIKSVPAQVNATVKTVAAKVVPLITPLLKGTTNPSLSVLKTTVAQAKTVVAEIVKTIPNTATIKSTVSSSVVPAATKTAAAVTVQSMSKEAGIDQVLTKLSDLRAEQKSDLNLPAEWVQRLVWTSTQTAHNTGSTAGLPSSADQASCETKADSEGSEEQDQTDLLPHVVDSVFSTTWQA